MIPSQNSLSGSTLRMICWALLVCAGTELRAGEPNADELAAAFSAKVLCSEIFVTQRAVDSALEETLYPFFALTGHRPRDITVLQVNRRRNEVQVALRESPIRTARLLGSQGCVILPADRDEVYFTPVDVKPSPDHGNERPWPMGDIPVRTELPKEVDPVVLGRAVDSAFEPSSHTASFLVIYRGQIVAERYSEGVEKETQLAGWSMGKSLTAILYGVASRLAHSWDPWKPAPVPEWQHPDDPRKSIRVADLMRMSSGLKFSSLEDDPSTWEHAQPDHILVYSGAIDVFDFVATRPPEYPPGTVGRYRNCDALLVGYLTRGLITTLGERYLEFPQRRLFDRIGIRNMTLETDPFGNFVLSGFEYGSTRDWGRLGMLMLQNGAWNGEQILPEDFVEFVSTPAPAWKSPVYGGLFWVNGAGEIPIPKTSYFMAGQGGQFVVMVPDYDLVVVRLGFQNGTQAATDSFSGALRQVLESISRR